MELIQDRPRRVKRRTIIVKNPKLGETTVKACTCIGDAVMEAARRWRVQWTVLARDPETTFEEVAEDG